MNEVSIGSIHYLLIDEAWGKGLPFWPLKAIKAARPKKAQKVKTFFCLLSLIQRNILHSTM